MDIRKMLEAQKKLDEKILNGRKILEHPQLLAVALVVEVSELANELQFFKYWKKNKKIDREGVLDEFADCLHFTLSICNTMFKFQIEKFVRDIDEYINDIKSVNFSLFNIIDRVRLNGFQGIMCELYHMRLGPPASYEPENCVSIFRKIIDMGRTCGFTVDEMENAYYVKNKINYERQDKGY